MDFMVGSAETGLGRRKERSCYAGVSRLLCTLLHGEGDQDVLPTSYMTLMVMYAPFETKVNGASKRGMPTLTTT